MEINELLKLGVKELGKREYLDPISESIIILSYLQNVDKSYIYTHGNEEVNKEIVDKFLDFIEKRKEGWPLSYILKEKEFYGLNFYIEEGVLVPRPDTEILVEWIINKVNEEFKNEYLDIVELGTGSGCIALTLAYYLENIKVFAVDIDDKALKVAKINRDKFKLNNKVKFYKGDLFNGIKTLQLEGKVDIIVSNPPYIPTEDISKLQIEVREHEPKNALDGGESGFSYYEKIVPDSKEYLKREGILAVEIGYDQGTYVKRLFNENGFKDIYIIKDFQGLDRVVVGRVP
ncbi:peptide chain release factor N(5)-glutamine methyltransferase [Anaerosalibacter massiliensis]|uniref:Release factor glutamine methyltransferase n=1 Tax=Anaerosalibacter massiliensis TaxID=1347392 RepID=A0A9X2MJJ0_9FIRM|nr:peptide chain release factor N(5)-glutamine methyltransferase [Anaerosalibacter massiliensis]MCR2044678.1 peptide chain release factor N(5)-glutamine methyltransferase [Anaerosalibacter massiliensis]